MSAKTRFSPCSARMAPALAALFCAALTACGSSPSSSTSSSSLNPVNWLTPYKVDVIQGNFVSKEQVEALQPGMSRMQVRDVLGTPLLASVFHADRWDYVFTLKRQGVEPQSYRYSVFFKGDQLARFEGDAMPSEAEFISKLDSKRKLGKVPALEATEAQLKAAEKAAPRASAASSSSASPGTTPQDAAPSAAAPATSYPPLESSAR